MIRRLFTFTLLFLDVLSAEKTYCQVLETEYSFSVRKTVLPGPNPEYEYVYNMGQLTVFEINKNWKKAYPTEKKKKLFNTKFSESQMKSLDSILVEINIESLDTSYSNPMMGGVYWTFDFRTKDQMKKVVLDNYYLKSLDDLIVYINKQIRENKRFISFYR